MTETELYIPVKNFFTSMGYDVKGEVGHCDVVATMGEQLVVVELKLQFNLKLLYQALERQKMTSQVYIAIPRPKRATDKAYKNMLNVLRRLGLGLITVALDSPVKTVEALLYPVEEGWKPVTKRQRKKANAVRAEAEKRILDGNMGGASTKTKRITVYRERCLQIACVLRCRPQATARALVAECGCSPNTSAILIQNVYGWFQRVEKGVYSLSPEGESALRQPLFQEVVAYYERLAASCGAGLNM